MGVIVISLGIPWSAGENVWCTLKHLGALARSLGAPTMSLGVPATSLGAPRITVEQSVKTTSLETLLVHLEIIATTYRSIIFKTHVFSLYSHLYIYTATHLHTVYLDWLQAVLKNNSRCTWQWLSSELRDTLWGLDRERLETHLDAMIECIWRYTWRLWSSKVRDGLRDRDQVNLEMHLEAMITRTWRPQSSEFRDIIGGSNQASLEMNWEPEFEQVSRYPLGGRNRVRLEIHLEAAMERDWMITWKRLMYGLLDAETLFISQLCCNRGNVTTGHYLWALMESFLIAVNCVGRHARSWWYIQRSTRNHEKEVKTHNYGLMLYLVYAVLGACCTSCMLHSVYAVLRVTSWSWHGEIERDDLTFCSEMMVELWMTKKEMGDEDENNVEDTSGYEKSGVWLAWLGCENLVLV